MVAEEEKDRRGRLGGGSTTRTARAPRRATGRMGERTAYGQEEGGRREGQWWAPSVARRQLQYRLRRQHYARPLML
eukprot:5008613-Pyramimonas_sp.AAC.1